MALDKLPSEVLELVFGYLGVFDRLAASSVCKQWYYASLNINVWKDAAIHINEEKATEGLNMLMNCDRPFSCVVFQDCCKDSSNTSQDLSALFCHALEMCRVVGHQLSVLQFKKCSISAPNLTQILTECPNLQHLGIVDCETLFFSQMWLQAPEEIDPLKLSLRNVKEVDLSCNNSLTDMFLIRLAQIFTNVKRLSLAKCPISFKAIVYQRFYPRLDIEPSDNILTFSRIKEFISSFATKITSLNFEGTSIDDTALKALAHIEGLQLDSISLLQCPLVTAKGIREICQYQKKLRKFDLPIPIALEQVLPEICANLQDLQELCVGCYWPVENLSSLLTLETHTLRKLVKLDLKSCCEIVVLKFIDSLRNEAYPQLRHLSLRNDKIDDYIFIYMVPYLLHITYLDLGGTLITDRSLIMISTHLVRLQVLQLSQCIAITDHGLIGHFETVLPAFLNPSTVEGVMMENMAATSFGNREFMKWLVFDKDHSVSLSNLRGLKELDLYGITGISDEGMQVAVVFKELKCLYIGGPSRITDEGLFTIAKNNRSLEVLSLKNSEDITENGIANILSCLPRLKLLDLRGCSKLTDSALSDLVKQFNFKLKYLF